MVYSHTYGYIVERFWVCHEGLYETGCKHFLFAAAPLAGPPNPRPEALHPKPYIPLYGGFPN